MRDTKAFASLSSGLLARKGQARPAMRPQGFAPGAVPVEDLGWNDMGHDVPSPARPPIVLPTMLSRPEREFPTAAEVPAVVRQQDEIAREFAAEPVADTPVPARPRKPARARIAPHRIVASRASGRKAAFTLRLDGDRHLRLRLACAVQNRSAQQIVTEALDRLLATLPDVERLATSLPAETGGEN